MSDEAEYKLLSLLEENPRVSQRELARFMGVSLGKVNYCLRAIIEKGWVKAGNFRKSEDKRAYFYMLTPLGVEQKAKITVRFLQRKIQEYEQLEQEIAALQLDLKKSRKNTLASNPVSNALDG